MRTSAIRMAVYLAIVMAAAPGAVAGADQHPSSIDSGALAAVFRGAQEVDLAESRAPSVVALREVVGIPPPAEKVLVRTFKREALPDALKPAFEKPGVVGVTIQGRYVAVIESEFEKEQADVLGHELVHAYITLASPKPLPFWFQEASAVHFSIDKARKFYGGPSRDQVGVMVGRTVELDETYKQKLHSFHYLIGKVGRERFYEWHRNAVMTGVVDAGPLLGLPPKGESDPPGFRKPLPRWLLAAAAAVVVVVAGIGFYVSRRPKEYW